MLHLLQPVAYQDSEYEFICAAPNEELFVSISGPSMSMRRYDCHAGADVWRYAFPTAQVRAEVQQANMHVNAVLTRFYHQWQEDRFRWDVSVYGTDHAIDNPRASGRQATRWDGDCPEPGGGTLPGYAPECLPVCQR